MKCEVCGKKKEMDFTMPTAGMMFTADLCMECGFSIHDNKQTIANIIKDRAKKRKIRLPCETIEQFEGLLTKDVKK